MVQLEEKVLVIGFTSDCFEAESEIDFQRLALNYGTPYFSFMLSQACFFSAKRSESISSKSS